MNRVINNFVNSIVQIRNAGKFIRNEIAVKWHGSMSYNKNEVCEEKLQNILKERFPKAKEIKVEDLSGGCGAMYRIYVETVEFKGLSIPNQHKAIYQALDNQIKAIHGVHVVTKIAN